ncbi:hypothetical protein OG873_24675 [Streptomyces violaceus]|uniref:Uncharacterized protein n=1 Tax=Streptomyces violaceus TaxID=1936 RepID=A0ABZ1NXH6_STRVL
MLPWSTIHRLRAWNAGAGADRIPDEARETADPVHLARLLGIHPTTPPSP